MLYLSKGMILKESTKQNLCVTLYGCDFILTGIGAGLWLAARFKANTTIEEKEVRHLRKLQELGLVELSDEEGTDAYYSLLTRCIICPANDKLFQIRLTREEKLVWLWISKAGLRLTIGELVKIYDSNVEPALELFGKENAQNLTLAIYSDDLLFDTVPDVQMAHSPHKDKVVEAILGLMRKKRIILI